MEWMHIVAHTRGGFDDVARWDSAAWLWPRMRAVFPDAAANVLMTNHTHTFAPCDLWRRAALRRVFQDHGRAFRTKWDMAEPQPASTRAIARRVVRYNLLNPVRAGLVSDPLSWPWSTLRDALDLVYDPWTRGDGVQGRLGLNPEELWRYTVRDEACGPEARCPLRRLDGCIAASFGALAAACASALRCRPDDRFRKGHACRATFVALALDVGRPPRAELAAACGVSVRAIPRLLRRADRAAVAASRRCLLDPRLHAWRTPAPGQRPIYAQ